MARPYIHQEHGRYIVLYQSLAILSLSLQRQFCKRPTSTSNDYYESLCREQDITVIWRQGHLMWDCHQISVGLFSFEEFGSSRISCWEVVLSTCQISMRFLVASCHFDAALSDYSSLGWRDLGAFVLFQFTVLWTTINSGTLQSVTRHIESQILTNFRQFTRCWRCWSNPLPLSHVRSRPLTAIFILIYLCWIYLFLSRTHL